jgi:hypothetical protein
LGGVVAVIEEDEGGVGVHDFEAIAFGDIDGADFEGGVGGEAEGLEEGEGFAEVLAVEDIAGFEILEADAEDDGELVLGGEDAMGGVDMAGGFDEAVGPRVLSSTAIVSGRMRATRASTTSGISSRAFSARPRSMRKRLAPGRMPVRRWTSSSVRQPLVSRASLVRL